MEQLIRFIVEKLVDNKDAININIKEEDSAVIIELSVAQEDVGKVIGKNGKVAQALRSILHSASYKETKKYILKIK